MKEMTLTLNKLLGLFKEKWKIVAPRVDMTTKGMHEPNGYGKESNVWVWNGVFVIFTHLVSLIAPFLALPDKRTIFLIVVIWQCSSIGITMGYHRLWSHRAFKARMPLRILLALCGTFGFQGSIKWWVKRHRLHHR